MKAKTDKVNCNTKYTYEYCLNEAKKYKTTADFWKFSKEACRASRYRGWINDYTWLEKSNAPLGYWNEDTCYEEARKYEYISDFHENSGGAYTVASKNRWIKNYTWLKVKCKTPRGYYTKERCYEEAKKYTEYLDFRKKSRCFYEHSKKNGWLKDYNWLHHEIMPRGYWNKETCYKEAKKYNSIQEFRKTKYPYELAKNNGWIEEYDWLCNKEYVDLNEVCDNVYAYIFEAQHSVYVGRTKHLRRRHLEHIRYYKNDTIRRYIEELNIDAPEMTVLETNISIKEGLEKEDYWKNYYKDLGYKILNKASTGPIGGSVGGFGTKKSRWTYEVCYEYAKTCSSRTEFSKKKQVAYDAARKNGWLDDYYWFAPVRKKSI